MQSSGLRLVLTIAFVALSSPTLARSNEVSASTWGEIEEAAYSLLEQDRIDDALALIEEAAPKLNDREFEVSDLILRTLFAAGRTEEALDAWENGLEKGYFYFIIPRQATYDTVRGSDRFESLLARNNRVRAAACSENEPDYEVVLPESYSPAGSYPLVMIIHGGNQSIVKAMGRWDSSAIGDDLLIAYLQSSRQADTKSYRWDLNGTDIYSAPTAQSEVLGLYEEIVGKYAVDTEQVILAGFSQGGNLSLTMASEGTIPARGFIAGCPAIRAPVSPETAAAAAARGVRGTIFVGANDWTADAVQTSVTHFEEAGLSIRHLVMQDKGHEFPDDFDVVLREAVADIRRRAGRRLE
jgi:poly(3-hydroxybutyrate) depolymerase